MQELSEAPELSQRAVYADVSSKRHFSGFEKQILTLSLWNGEKIFGFKHTMNHIQIDLDPNEQTAARYRLYARVIRVIGMSQISDLQPFLQAKLEKTLIEEIDSQSTVDGMSSKKKYSSVNLFAPSTH